MNMANMLKSMKERDAQGKWRAKRWHMSKQIAQFFAHLQHADLSTEQHHYRNIMFLGMKAAKCKALNSAAL